MFVIRARALRLLRRRIRFTRWCFPDQPKTDFLTNTFRRNNINGSTTQRVFWTWYNPSNKANEGKVVWEARGTRAGSFGNSRALYKMYFTSSMRELKETADQSPCVRFAREFLPEVNKALSEVQSETPGGDSNAKPITATKPKERNRGNGPSTAARIWMRRLFREKALNRNDSATKRRVVQDDQTGPEPAGQGQSVMLGARFLTLRRRGHLPGPGASSFCRESCD